MIRIGLIRRMVVFALTLALLLGSATAVFADSKGKSNGNKGNNGNNGKKQEQKYDPKNNQSNNQKVKLTINFNDLDQVKWALQQILNLSAKQVFAGYEDGSFKPNQKMTRVEAITAAVKLMGLNEQAQQKMDTKLNFKDADQISKNYKWAVGYVAVAAENGLFAETETKLQPEKPADRLWATTLLVKAMRLDSEALAKMNAHLPFRDAHKIPAGSVGYVAIAVEKGLVKGYEDNTFRPDVPVTRAEMAVLLNHMDDQLPDTDANAVRGTVSALVSSNVITLVKNGVTSSFAIDPSAFVFRNGVKVNAADLKIGDEVLVRTYNNVVIFIEVTKPIDQNAFTVAGTFNALMMNSQGKMATISITQTVNGTQQVKVYNIDSNAKIIGDPAKLVAGQAIELHGTGQIITSIEIKTAPSTNFTTEGVLNMTTLNAQGKIATISITQTVNGAQQVKIYNVDTNASIVGEPAKLVSGQVVQLKGIDQIVTSIIIKAETFTTEGTFNSLTLNAEGKISTINITRIVNGAQVEKLFHVDTNATIVGDPAKLIAGQELLLKGSDQLVTSIEIVATQNIDFTVDGTFSSTTMNNQGQIATITILQTINGTQVANVYDVASNVAIKGDLAKLVAGQTVQLKGIDKIVTSIEIKAQSSTDFAAEGKFQSLTLNNQGKIATITITHTVNKKSKTTTYNVSPDVVFHGELAKLLLKQSVKLEGVNQVVTSIEIK